VNGDAASTRSAAAHNLLNIIVSLYVHSVVSKNDIRFGKAVNSAVPFLDALRALRP